MRLVANLGYDLINPGASNEVKVPDVVCTQAVTKGGAQFLIVNPPRPSSATKFGAPYSFTIPGLDSAGSIAIEVP